MANIATDFSPDAVPFPFNSYPSGGVASAYTAIPRGRICYREPNGTIAAKIATNTGSVEVSAILPLGYAYILEYLFLSVRFATDLDDASHYADNGQLRFQLSDGQSTRHNNLLSEGLTPIELNAGSLKTWNPVNAIPLPLYNLNANTMGVLAGVYDTDLVNATQAGVLSYFSCFLQYDIEQVFNLGVNFPIPIQVR